MMTLRAAPLLMLCVLLPQTAGGHAGAEWAALEVERPGLVEGSFGLLVDRPGDEGLPPWGWTCHEAITQPDALLTPRYTAGVDADGAEVVLASLVDLEQARDEGRAVYRSTDLCDWEAVEGLPEEPFADVVFLDDQRAVAATTSTLQDGGGVAFYRSEDAGQTWEPVELHGEGTGRTLLGITPDGEGGAWAVSYAEDAPDQARVHRTVDGAVWTAEPLSLDGFDVELPEGRPVQVRTLAADGDRAWIGVADPGGHLVLATDDDGETWDVVLRGEGVFVAGAVDDGGAVWMLESNRAVWRAEDGRAFAAIEGAPLSEGIAPTGEGGAVTLTTSELLTDALTFRMDAEGVVTPSLQARDVRGPLECPPESDHTAVCEPLWFLVSVPQPIDPSEPGDTGEPPEEPGCGCSAPGSRASSAVLILALLGLVVRRRRC